MIATAIKDFNNGEESRIPFYALESAAVLKCFNASKEGLSSSEALTRLRQYGANLLPRAKRDGVLTLIARQINNPLIWVLIVSALIAMVADWDGDGIKNSSVILAVVIINSVIGFAQEFKAGKAIEALSKMVPVTVTALRDNRKSSIPASDLVPGDVVLLAPGDFVPADLRLISSKNLQTQEAMLTGESLPVSKSPDPVKQEAALGDRRSMAFAGTLVTYGAGVGVVISTGVGTELGKISALLNEVTSLETPLTRTLGEIGAKITVGILVLTVLMLAIGMVRTMTEAGVSITQAFGQTLIFAIALAVGAIPEGLPAIVTIALAIGVQRMAKRRAIVRKLPAVETLGSTTVICSDKTGTLTRNEMTVRQLQTPQGAYEVTGVGYKPTGSIKQGDATVLVSDDILELLGAAVLCNDATLHEENGVWAITGDPTEGCLVVAAEKVGISVEQVRREHPIVDVIPFESENQFMATLHSSRNGGQRIFLKGAPEVVISRCQDCNPLSMAAKVESLAAEGMRVLAIAALEQSEMKEVLKPEDIQSNLKFLGLVAMIDPPREEVIRSIEVCHRAGIEVKMITGDHQATAAAIGRQLGILTADGALSERELAVMSKAELREAAGRVNVFARVTPEHKLRLVQALQSRNEVVAMTGDGVNDAPALKQANIGIAMGITGTAASKQAADIVLTDDNFASIGAAVEEGRRVFDNLTKSLAFVLPTNLGLALILTYAVAFFPFDSKTGELLLVLSPLQLLWINLVATISLALPLAFEAHEPDVMKRPPRRSDTSIFGTFLVVRTVVVSVLMSAITIGVFIWEYQAALAKGVSSSIALAESQTIAVTAIILFQCFYLANCRSLRHSFMAVGFFTNKIFYLGVALVLMFQAGFIYLPVANAFFGSVPLDFDAWVKAVTVGALILPAMIIDKQLLRLRQGIGVK